MIKLTKKVLTQALDCGLSGTVIVNANQPGWPVVYVNPAIEAMTRCDAGELIGRRLKDLVCDGDLPAFPWERSRRLRQQWTRKTGEAFQVEFQLSPLYEGPGQPSYLLLSQCSEEQGADHGHRSEDSLRIALKDARVRLKRLERTDSVTGLANRHTFLEVLQRDWGIARRQRRRISVIVFRLDDFEHYRELFGRHAAECCLRKVAHAINGALRREGEFVARYDSDRFAVLNGSADEESVRNFAAKITEKMRGLSIHHPRSKVDRFVTLSSGVASEIPESTVPCSMLIETAEAELEQSDCAEHHHQAG